MKAVVFNQGRIVVEDREIPELNPGEVLVQVKASAICRSDLHLLRGAGPVGSGESKPIVPGHEPAGVVVRVDSHAKGVHEGDRVAIYLAIGCEQCESCRRGWPLLCNKVQFVGVDRDGGDQEFMTVPYQNCLPIPQSMSFADAAVSLDTLGGLYWTCKSLGVSGRDTVAIYGLGPMGTAGVLVAKAMGALVVAIEPNELRRHLAVGLGADLALDPTSSEFGDQVLGVTHGRGFDVALECSGAPTAQNAALNTVAKFGRVGFLGESNATQFHPSDQLIRKLVTVQGGWYFPRWGYEEIVRFLQGRRIRMNKLVTDTFPLEDAATAFEKFDAGLTGKVLFSPS